VEGGAVVTDALALELDDEHAARSPPPATPIMANRVMAGIPPSLDLTLTAMVCDPEAASPVLPGMRGCPCSSRLEIFGNVISVSDLQHLLFALPNQTVDQLRKSPLNAELTYDEMWVNT